MRLDIGVLTISEGESLWQQYPHIVNVEFPSPKTQNQWELKSDSWVGFIAASPRLGLELYPKVPLANIFRMLEFAYQIDPRWLPELANFDTLEDFFERLAVVLSRRILARVRKGLHRSYVAESDRLPYLRGTLDLTDTWRRPGASSFACDFHEHTSDIEDNRILVWTLSRIARSALCTERSRPHVRRAYHATVSAVRALPVPAIACVGRAYHRLNDDYRPLHALCRFFLESTGPTHESGNRTMLPFVIEMSGLFERFVAEWLRAHLPNRYYLRYQEQLSLGGEAGLDFRIDMVLYDRATERPVCVVDAKYKAPERVDPADFNQVVVYAKAKQCQRAILVYPQTLPRPIDATLGDDVRVRSSAFVLDGDLDAAGRDLLASLV